jgi:hypothetical protein
MNWHQLDTSTVSRTVATQDVPKDVRPRDIQTTVADKRVKHERIANALTAAGFNLAWRPSQAPVRFRELQAEPLDGAVAPSFK